IINQVKKTGCRVIVNDMCWSRTASNFFRTELKRLAAETNALYFSAEDVYGKEMISSLNDGVHPGIDGHHMIGNALLAAMKGEPMPTIPTTSSPSAPTPSYVVKDGYAIAFQAPLKDTSVWQVGDGQLFAPYPEAVKPALILTPQEDGLVIVRTNDSLQPWTDARTYVDTTVDLTADKLYYKINAECLWNMTLSFADEKDSLAEDSMVKLGSYIVKQQKGTSIGYHEDAPAGVYEGFLDLTEVIQDAVKQEVLSPLYAESLSAQYIGRLNFWHVAGTPNQSKVIISDLFIGHEDSNASDATNTDPSDPTETPDDTTTAPTDGGTAPSTPKDNPQTGENTLLLLVDAFLLLVSVGMLLITHKMRKAEK
ncbi:MAG: hypothetical protein HFJ80_07905, partial [Clostridiales bacterium]|nr:hypothetical protein [Clostridiales bacterium]